MPGYPCCCKEKTPPPPDIELGFPCSDCAPLTTPRFMTVEFEGFRNDTPPPPIFCSQCWHINRAYELRQGSSFCMLHTTGCDCAWRLGVDPDVHYCPEFEHFDPNAFKIQHVGFEVCVDADNDLVIYRACIRSGGADPPEFHWLFAREVPFESTLPNCLALSRFELTNKQSFGTQCTFNSNPRCFVTSGVLAA